MKRKFIFIIITLIFLSLSGCFSNIIRDQLNPWIGHTEAELIHSWGAPARDYPDGKGGKILIYNQRSSDGSTRVTQMYINKEGKIYYWQVNWE
jgi:ABC-type phosphate transport system substrate-binding protein